VKSSRDGAKPAPAYGIDYMHEIKHILKGFASENTIAAALKVT
jgi:hypothetical protein